jgi:O-antigen/teichoic acid export membrane protein
MIAHTKASILRLLPKSQFARSVSVLVGGTASAQLLIVLTAPILTRLYLPEDFGMVAIFMGLIALINIFSSLRYELAIPLPEDDQEAVNLVALCLLILLGITICSILAVLFFGVSIAVILGVPKLANYLWLLPVGVLFSGTYLIFNYWTLRTKHFTRLAYTKLRQTLVSIAIQLTTFKFGGISLVFAQIVGQSLGIVMLGKPMITRPEFKQITFAGIRQAAAQYRRFPIFTTWAGLLNTGGNQLPPLVFAALFSVGGAGVYALTHRVLTLPMSLVGNAVQSVFFSNASEAYRNGHLSHLVTNVCDKLVQIAMPLALILVFVAPDLFVFVFGGIWQESGEFARWMSPWLFLQFCTGPLATVFAAIEKQHIGLIMQAQLFIVRVIMILIGATSGDLQTTIVLFSFGSAVSYLVFLVVIFYTTGAQSNALFRSLSRAFLLSIIVISPLFYLSLVPEPQTSLIITSVVTTLALVFLRYGMLYRYGV